MVASYVIGELRSDAERRRVVSALWQRTSGLLVLLEPGTPVGSANIREARSQVPLALERRLLIPDPTRLISARNLTTAWS